MTPGDWTAIAALVVSAWSAFKTITYGQTQNKLNNSLLEDRERKALESKKAGIAVTLEGLAMLGSKEVLVHNIGAAPARKVRFEESGDYVVLDKNHMAAKLPYEVLWPQQNFSLAARIYAENAKSKFEFTILWADDASEDNRQTFYVAR